MIGGRSDEYDRYFGLFIKRVLPGGLADTDGECKHLIAVANLLTEV